MCQTHWAFPKQVICRPKRISYLMLLEAQKLKNVLHHTLANKNGSIKLPSSSAEWSRLCPQSQPASAPQQQPPHYAPQPPQSHPQACFGYQPSI